MAEKRDLLDDLIDIQQDWASVSNPLGGIADTLAADPSKVRQFDPSEFKERPRVNSIFCLRVSSGRDDVCSRCLDVCPVDAIQIKGAAIKVLDSCRKCGLCTMACPTEAFLVQRIMAKQLYDKIVRVASAYEQCYVTCTRAIGRLPKDNEVVLPCVGAMPTEVWHALLSEFDNVSVYLPLGICDRCRTTTGEAAYVDQIGQAEEWSGGSVGLEVDEGQMTHEQTRAYKRGQFVNSMVQAGQTALLAGNPSLLGAKAVAQRIQDHSRKITSMQRELERMVGDKTTANRRRVLTQKRKTLLTTLQGRPRLARPIVLDVPSCDPSRCTMCGDCVKACPVHACDLDAGGRFSVEAAYCLNCGACAKVCPEGALTMVAGDPQQLVVRDEEAERRARAAAKQREQVQKAKEEGKRQLKRGLDILERLADD
ncbi:4Fe-4S binding protein [Olsenella phocaeensis]|uniref:4Fe-4S binding protein n=1 Tax=Olsenella phocaeensis TaxID=1852385 RepID=UPI00092FF6D9|nr:4Fe-4S binding protein [Olsenella phocaeensis]